MAKSYYKSKKRALTEEELQRQELFKAILDLKAQIEYGEELMVYFHSTMKHFSFPHNRVKGTDLIYFELNEGKIREALTILEKKYTDQYGTDTTNQSRGKRNSRG